LNDCNQFLNFFLLFEVVWVFLVAFHLNDIAGLSGDEKLIKITFKKFK